MISDYLRLGDRFDTNGAKDNFGGKRNVLEIDHGNSYKDLWIFLNVSKCTLKMGPFSRYELYLSKVYFNKQQKVFSSFNKYIYGQGTFEWGLSALFLTWGMTHNVILGTLQFPVWVSLKESKNLKILVKQCECGMLCDF